MPFIGQAVNAPSAAAAPPPQGPRHAGFAKAKPGAPRSARLYEHPGNYLLECQEYKEAKQYAIFTFIVKAVTKGDLAVGDECSFTQDLNPPTKVGGEERAYKNIKGLLYPMLGVDLKNEAEIAQLDNDPRCENVLNEMLKGTAFSVPLLGLKVISNIYHRITAKGAEVVQLDWYAFPVSK